MNRTTSARPHRGGHGWFSAVAVIVLAVINIRRRGVRNYDVRPSTAAAPPARRTPGEGRWKTLLAAAALVATLIAAVIGAYATISSTNHTAEVALTAQYADRFTKAIEQLADEKSESVRLGGVHSLLRLVTETTATDEAGSYRGDVNNVIRPYINHRLDLARSNSKDPARVTPTSDVLAALEGLSRVKGEGPLVLSRIALPGAYLREVNLRRAHLTGSDLAGADMAGVDLTWAGLAGANLAGATLTKATLAGATLTKATLTGANLAGANLAGANLAGAGLYGADLPETNLARANLAGVILAKANLRGANLRGANLMGADLSAADLRGANFDQAKMDSETLWSTGIKPSSVVSR